MTVYTDKDPIVAIATAPGRGGVGIIRLSASDEVIQAFIAKYFAGQRLLKARFAHLRTFHDVNNQVIDEGLALYFPAPKSYTGESVLELQGHGGPVVLRLLLETVLDVGKEWGMRLAEPGEFTKRAFLNGRLDLSQAEAVADLIDATTEGAARAASRSLNGKFSEKIHEIASAVIELRALIEAILDFPEEEIDFIKSTHARERMQDIVNQYDALMHMSQQGSILREGVTAVLVGSPNVGKSSLMNYLSGADVAIVTEVAGTTRDKIENEVNLGGVALRLVDTAGVRNTEDKVEAIGIERTLQAVEKADVVLHLFDATAELTDDEGAATLEKVRSRIKRGVPVINVLNKCDLTDHLSVNNLNVIKISAKTGQGIDELKKRLLDIVGWENNPEATFLARERHLQALAKGKEHLMLAQSFVLIEPPPMDLLAEELRLVNSQLGEVVGETTPDDILDIIFSRFCIGK
ncbi:MAG: tRNA uridine-5-carboxymethylaminomethyl(34) synthesis GTPase MnmE [Candidatus Aphodousia sp.]|nr:tRNA uridine-5-carboxymethylaminomethyl(34) synthesis GTPase MnmE [Sutterella sp.]MDY2898976.1 tRNA uridine-5-carboxymethylaminomethyl(34) synthesis GTPase MnmE [Candidatus Aphodousia sp.]